MEYRVDQVKKVLIHCANRILENKKQLEIVDSQAGDGDLGISMQKGSVAVIQEIVGYEGSDLGMMFMKSAMALNKAAPSTMGTLLCAGLMQLGKTFSKKNTITEAEAVEIPSIFSEAIMSRGKAAEGDRTVLDALLPMARSMKNAFKSDSSLVEAVIAGAEAAKSGMEKTQDMVPKIGRSKWIPENAMGIVDGGALLCWIVAQGLLDLTDTPGMSSRSYELQS